MRARRSSGESGQALATVTLLLFALVMLGAGLVTLAGYEVRSTQQDLDSQRAFWLAEAARQRTLRYLTQSPTPPESTEVVFEDVAGPEGGTYTASVIPDTSATWASEKPIMIDCIGQAGSRQRHIRQLVRMTSFAQYFYFTHAEQAPGEPPIWFTTGDVVEGAFHTNGTLRIQGSPHFMGAVTSASDRMIAYPLLPVFDAGGWPAGGSNPTFDQGFELNAAPIPLPTTTLDLRAQAQTGGLYLTGAPSGLGGAAESMPSTIELGRMGTSAAGTSAPGWLRYKSADAAWDTAVSVQISSLAKPIVYSDADLEISGVLDGQLTVASVANIIIVDDLVYAGSTPGGQPLPGCDDMLGVVAENNILIDYDPSVSPLPTQDLKVDGVLLAMNTSISAMNYDQGPPRGTLTIWGGLVQQYRGPVGRLSGGTTVSGYSKDYHYDERMSSHAPPGFPVTGHYEEISWTENWDESYPF